MIDVRAILSTIRSRSSLSAFSFSSWDYLVTLRVLVSIPAEMTASCPNAKEKGMSFIPELGVVHKDYRILGSSSGQASLASFNLFFIATRITPLMASV